MKKYDVIIIGAGPAGLTAGIYSARAGLKTAIIEKGQIGGQISLTSDVDNYPGVVDAQGPMLTFEMLKQAEKFGAEKINDEIIQILDKGAIKILESKKESYETKAIIYATGAQARKLEIPGESEFVGRGVGYCATCDGAFYAGSDVYVVGGGDAALEEAIFLTKFAKRVIILNRDSKLKAAKSIQDHAFNNPKIEIRYNKEVIEVKGEVFAKSIMVKDNISNEIEEITNLVGEPPIGLFIFIGYKPNTKLVEGLLVLEDGYVKASEDTITNIQGIFVAGDVRTKDVRQIVTATSDGAVAAIQAEKYISNLI